MTEGSVLGDVLVDEEDKGSPPKECPTSCCLCTTLEKSCFEPHLKYMAICNNTHKKSHNVLSKFMIVYWAAFIAILGCLRPLGHGLDTAARAF